jgi:hypothetical protein
MKMLKYLNKRILVCLCLALIFLIVTSFVASSEEDKGDVKIIDFNQEQRGKVTREIGGFINFNWEITKKPPSYLTDHDYYLKILDASGKEVYSNTFKTPTQHCSNFSGKDSWEVSPDIELGKYTSILRVPYKPPLAEFKGIEFEVVKTLLVIRKFNDTNQNHKLDDVEKLRDWEFKVTDPFGENITYETDRYGEIRIEIPEGKEGNYNITEIIDKPGWEFIEKDTDAPIVKDEDKQWIKIRVEKGKESMVKFLNIYHPPPTTTLLIQKSNDTNRNRVLDDSDKRAPGWEFKVTDPDGKTTTHFTNDLGEIEIKIPRKYEGKDYTIEEILKPGCWKPILPIRQTAKGESKTVQFLNIYEPTVLLIQKVNDTNRNRILDDTEKLSGWEFQVTYPAGKTANYITDSKGEIEIKVPPGSYTVKEIPKRNWTAITPIIQNKNVAECITTPVIFHNLFTPRILLITKYYDHNVNGKRDSGEEGRGNWEFEIKYPDGSVETVTTDSDGIYERHDPPIGKYTISEQPQPCWKNSTPIVRDVEITPDRGAEVEFGNFEVGNLTIQKFYDDNRNKVQEYGDEGLPNWTFTITFPDRSSKRITTDANGTYTLINVPIGRYTITEEAMTCRWMNSTSTTQYVEVTAFWQLHC